MTRISATRREERYRWRVAAVADALGRWISRHEDGVQVTCQSIAEIAVRTLDEFERGYRAAMEQKALPPPPADEVPAPPSTGSVFDFAAIRAALKKS